MTARQIAIQNVEKCVRVRLFGNGIILETWYDASRIHTLSEIYFACGCNECDKQKKKKKEKPSALYARVERVCVRVRTIERF